MNPGRLLVVLLLLASSIALAQPQAGTVAILKSEQFDARQLLRDLQVLSADDMEGRQTGTRGNAMARDYAVRRFKESGILPLRESYLHPFPQGINVAGYIKGRVSPERYLVVSAHYDHVGMQFGRIFNGADDNASGVAALFALGTYFQKHRPDTSILFAAFDAEEAGLAGSREFLRNPPVPKSSMIMNINIDMIGRDRISTLFAVGTYQYPFLRPLVDMVIPKARVKLLVGHDRPGRSDEDWTEDSDHYSFHREGIPFIYIGVEDYEYHHEADDDYENIMPAFYVGSVETVIEAIRVFDAHSRDIERASRRQP